MSERGGIYYKYVNKILVSARFFSPYLISYGILGIYVFTVWKTIYSSKKWDLIYYDYSKNKVVVAAESDKGDVRSAQRPEVWLSEWYRS